MVPTHARRFSLLSALLILSCLVAACDDASDPVLTDADGVKIKEIAIYQSVKRTLIKDGQVKTSKIPLIAERDALVRVFYETDSAYDGEEVTARLTIKGNLPVDVKTTLGAASSEKDLKSTINFYPPKTQITDPLDYSIEILQQRDDAEDHPDARYPASGYAAVKVDGKKNTLRVMLVPFRYNADGSGRVPNTSAAQLQKFKERFLQLYPVSDVVISLHAPIDWTKAIAGTGAGWQEVGMRLMQVRSQDKIPDDTYLYGFFNPAGTLQAFCGFGCMLGVTLLNNNPPDTGNVSLRLALGVGFVERATDTAAHEIGHSHGRMHANCGPGLAPSSIDPSYPSDTAHQGGKIGIWGFDMFAKKLVDPTYSDIMGYCDKKWISDYNYAALWNRGKNVNLASWDVPPGGVGYDLISLDGAGSARWQRPIRRQRPLSSGNPVPVTLDGRTTVQGELFRFDHMPGAWLFIPQTRSSSASFLVDGRMFRVNR